MSTEIDFLLVLAPTQLLSLVFLFGMAVGAGVLTIAACIQEYRDGR